MYSSAFVPATLSDVPSHPVITPPLDHSFFNRRPEFAAENLLMKE